MNDAAHAPVVVIFNPRAGSARNGDLARLERVLGARSPCAFVTETSDPSVPARAAVAAGAREVIAVGGDGTVSSVASALVGSPTRLGIVPRGTANSIASALGIPHGVDAACAVIAQGHTRVVDSACVGERSMLLMATIGLHARAITDTSDEAKAAAGVLAYMSKGLMLLLSAEPFEVEVAVDDYEVPLRASVHALTIANIAGPRSFLAQGPPEVIPDDGLLDLTLVAFDGVLDALATSVHLFRNALEGLPAARDSIGFLRARSVAVRAVPQQPVMIDGEPAGETPFVVRCRPRTLTVLAPEPAERAHGTNR